MLVAYFPNPSLIIRTINSLANQVAKLILVDNSDNAGKLLFSAEHKKLCPRNVEFINLGENQGIACAQNIGIKKAIAEKADYVLLSDQDSEFPDNYVSRMILHLSAQKSEISEEIAVIAPDFEEMNRGGERQGFTVNDGFYEKKIEPKSGCHKVSQVIASGKIISIKSLEKIGLMNEKLFIDWVDFEWCWRAKWAGFSIIGCADVVIQHSLGDKVHSVLKKSYSIRSPIRHYYVIRNGIYLSIYSPYIYFFMRVNILVKCFRYLIGFTILGKPHLKHFKYCIRGFADGIRGRLGECPYNRQVWKE